MSIRATLLYLVCACTAASPSSAQDQSCSWTERAGNGFLRNFLEKQSGARESPCITLAIQKLGGTRKDVKSIPLLVRYLDYRHPENAPMHGGGLAARGYPAVFALAKMGRPAVPKLVATIENSTSATIRNNASFAYMIIYEQDLASGIRRLKAEHASGIQGERLKETLQMLVSACAHSTPTEEAACKTAESLDHPDPPAATVPD